MVRIAPVRLSFNPKTLWFDSGDLDLHVGDAVVVSTVRGSEFGRVSDAVFEMSYEDVKKLKSPLKPVKRLATEEDAAKSDEMLALSREALPTFRRLAAESVPDMNPVAVEYLFDGDKAVFYFESEERVDFRDLVRRLASEFHVRVDMKQIGVRDGARMVGGLGHCGQELCCRRLGGEFNPVSIRMAKEQDLSLNPQKISGVCGRLMCCLRYEYDAYKDFHGRAPKKGARIQTPDGEGKVVDLNVPREVVSIKVGDEKPVKVPLADMEPASEGSRPNAVGQEAWERANAPAPLEMGSASVLFTNELSGDDKLAEPGKVRHVHDEEGPSSKSTRSRSRRRRSGGNGNGNGGGEAKSQGQQKEPQQPPARKSRRRRSTTVKSDGSTSTAKQPQQKAAGQGGQKQGKQQGKSQVGRNSSALRANRPENGDGSAKRQGGNQGTGQRRRRRSHKGNSSGESKSE